MKTFTILNSICAVAIAGLSFAATGTAEARGGSAHVSGGSFAAHNVGSMKLAKLPIGPIGPIKPVNPVKPKPPIGPIKVPPIKLPPIVKPPVKPPVTPPGKPPRETHNHYRYGGGEVVVATYSSCRWLKVRALETGAGYWWARYEACRNDE